jgi:hypothetical protein
VTSTEWTGKVPAYNFFNYTPKAAEVTWSYTYLGSEYTGVICVYAGNGGDLYVPAFVTKVSWQTTTC